ncbi:MAG: phosphoribosylanthranilate isomerase [Candidatus Omnitrophota bacterium]
MVKVKICGITNLEDALMAGKYGADLLGFIFVENTLRNVEMNIVKDIIFSLNTRGFSNVAKVGLFKDENQEKVSKIVKFCELDHVQLHGNETPEYCKELKTSVLKKCGRDIRIIKAFKVADKILSHGSYGMSDYDDADYLVFDTFKADLDGGTGKEFSWDILIEDRIDIKKQFFVAGGITPENVKEAVKRIQPYGIDVSSGVEEIPGKKDERLLKEFVKNAKSA